MLKLASLLIGENPARTALFQPASQRKIQLLASCLLIPVVLWFLNGYLLVSHVLRGGVVAALLTAVVAALVIFLIERSVIMAKGSQAITIFRFLLGIVVALLGSISLDEVVFKQDIDTQVATYKAAYVSAAQARGDSSFRAQTSTQQQLVTKKYQAWQEALAHASGEADGSSGSGIAKVGRIAQLKLRVAAAYGKEYDLERVKLEALNLASKANLDVKGREAGEAFRDNALLLRLRAMHDLVKQDSYMLGLYLLFTAFLFFLEFIVVIIKTFSTKSIDEKLEEKKDKLILLKAQRTLDGAVAYFEPEAYDSRVSNAKVALEMVRNRRLLQ